MKEQYLLRSVRRGWIEENKTNPEDTPYHDLIAEVLARAVKDYAGREIRRDELCLMDVYKADARNFLLSGYCELMLPGDITGQQIIDHIDEHGLSEYFFMRRTRHGGIKEA